MDVLRSRPRGAWLLAGGLLSLVLCPGLQAQDAPVPAAPPTAPAEAPPPAEGAVKLAFKHNPGAAQRFVASATMDITMGIEGAQGAGGLGAIPVSLKMNIDYLEKTTGVKEGLGSITATVRGMTINSSVMGTSTVVKSQGGKVSVTQNGKVVPAAAGAGSEQLKALANPKPLVFRRDALGRTTMVSMDPSMGGLFNQSAGILQFPDRPVAVGESWETVQKVQPNIPGPAGGGGEAAPEIEVRFTHSLKALETKNGKQFAILETSGAGEMPEGGAGPIQSVKQGYTGTTRFDVARGAIVSGSYNTDFNMKMALPGGLGGAVGAPGFQQGQAPTAMRMDGVVQMNIREAPLVPATPAKPAAKKPAAKKPVRKKR